MKKQKNMPSLIGRYPSLGLTFYKRGDIVCARSCTSEQPNRQTPAQFRNRERVRSLIALWKSFPIDGKPLMESPDGLAAYQMFQRVNAQLPAAYLTKQQRAQNGAVLVPDMYVSAGRLEPMEYHFETVEGVGRLLVTNLATSLDPALTQPLGAATPDALSRMLVGRSRNPLLRMGDMLRFYALRQRVEEVGEMGVPRLEVRCATIALDDDLRPFHFLPGHELYTHSGCLAVGGADDVDTGYAVVIYDPLQRTASTQTVATEGTLYGQYTSEEAFNRAAKTYTNICEGLLTPLNTTR
ncbi:MAG: hypothetical protein J5641_03445 [Bacteroidales bacterium]|nr:hypothetical protein [Bacteroidales bacterium]